MKRTQKSTKYSRPHLFDSLNTNPKSFSPKDETSILDPQMKIQNQKSLEKPFLVIPNDLYPVYAEAQTLDSLYYKFKNRNLSRTLESKIQTFGRFILRSRSRFQVFDCCVSFTVLPFWGWLRGLTRGRCRSEGFQVFLFFSSGVEPSNPHPLGLL